MELVTLKSGPTLPVRVVQLAVELEDRGYALVVDGETLILRDKSGTLGDTLPESAYDEIRKWKQYLLAVVSYEAPSIP